MATGGTNQYGASEALKTAINAAGVELRDTHGWSLGWDDVEPVSDTLFAKILLKHIAPVVDPSAMQNARKVRIAVLRAELAALSED